MLQAIAKGLRHSLYFRSIRTLLLIVNTHLPPFPLINVVMDLVMIFKVTSNNIERGRGVQKCIKVFHLFSRVRFQLVVQFLRRMSQQFCNCLSGRVTSI